MFIADELGYMKVLYCIILLLTQCYSDEKVSEFNFFISAFWQVRFNWIFLLFCRSLQIARSNTKKSNVKERLCHTKKS